MIKRFICIVFFLLVSGSVYAADVAKQVDFLLNGYRSPTTDAILSGGKVYTYTNGTTTLNNLYTDRDKAGDAANPIILGTDGTAEVYGDGIYKFRIYDSDDVFIQEITGLDYRINELVVDNIANYSSLTAAVSAIGATPTTLVIGETTTCTANTVVPATLKLIVEKGGTIDNQTFALTINGPFEAGVYEIWPATGVQIQGLDYALVDWWGTDKDAIDSAIAASLNTHFAPGGSYTITSALAAISDSGQRLVCDGYKQGATLTYTPTTGTMISIAADSCEIGGFMIQGPGTTGTDVAIKIESGQWRNKIRDIRIDDVAVAVENAGYDNVLTNFYFADVGLAGYKNTGGSSGSIEHGYISNGTKTTASAIDINTATHLLFSDVKIGQKMSYGFDIASGNNFDLIDCHVEQSGAGADASVSDIRLTSTTPNINIIGGRYGDDNLTGVTFDLASSGGDSNRINMVGAYFAGNHAGGGGNGHFEDNEGSYISIIGMTGATILPADFTVGEGTVDWTNRRIIALDGAQYGTSGTGEDTLATTTLVAYAYRIYDEIDIHASGIKEGAGGNKTIKLYIGTDAYTVHAAANNTNDWRIDAKLVFRPGLAASQRLSIVGYDGTTITQQWQGPTQDGTAAIIIKITGECASATDYIKQRLWSVVGR